MSTGAVDTGASTALAQAPDSARAVLRDTIGALEDRLTGLSHRLHANPETAWEEEKAARWTASLLDELGYAVTPGVCELPTAFAARIGSGPLHVALCAEYDALPGLGHACGHNLIAAAAVGAAGALARVADDLGLTVTVLGTPAEEGGGGKILMLERGAFEGVDVAMMVHPGPVDVAEAEPFAVAHLNVQYTGRAAHAAAYPEQGRNAADAFTVAQVGIGLLRQQLPSTTRVHGLVTRGGEAPNAIPERTEGRWYVRASSLEELDRIQGRVEACFRAGALASGCALEIEPESPPYSEFRNDAELVARYRRNAEGIGRRFAPPGDPAARMNRASTDMGNVSRVVRALHPYIGVGSLPAVNHQREFAAACATATADAALLDGALALALTAADLAAGGG
ncbi:M20 family metallopeptidase [Streptacidiphilus jiangxiensis]|uniref:Peptidase M20 domain-containing protein 2 n=1 Tax=Streptacidiphilus jiangxiensis TaxID=235985 RepID=A0A1H7V302_STRJI|nr:M20 family metallopeptidase [Streptacidiphilus jiangxiensis]SEM03533.1 amidohydrolase [Streptacidiphilus jiangxiensis]